MNKKDLKFEYIRGEGPGGQHKNKTCSCVKVTHIPTGLTVKIDGRNQHSNKRKALRKLQLLLDEQKNQQKAEQKKVRRNKKIKDKTYIRTYDFKSMQVINHITHKKAPLKEVLHKGRIDLINTPNKD